MTTDKQRGVIVAHLAAHYGHAFKITAERDEIHAAFPIWTPAGKYEAARYRYATAVARRNLDGRRGVSDVDLAEIIAQIDRRFLAGQSDPRYTDQARADYRAAVIAGEVGL